MKNMLKTGLLALVSFLAFSNVSFAQDTSKVQAYYIHEDPVHPSMTTEYDQQAANLVTLSKKYGVKEGWLTFALDDFKYFYVSPIKNMADLDKNTFSPILDKIGETAFSKLFIDFDKCYDSHRDYIVYLNKALSYTPSGLDIKTEGKPFRQFSYYYVTPENLPKLREIAKAFHALYTKKGSKLEYRVYRNGFGEKEDYFMVVSSAKNAAEYEKMRAESNELLGDEGKKLYGDLLKVISGVKHITGMMRPDLSLMPAN